MFDTLRPFGFALLAIFWGIVGWLWILGIPFSIREEGERYSGVWDLYIPKLIVGLFAVAWFGILMPVLILSQLMITAALAARATRPRWEGIELSKNLGGFRSPLILPIEHSRFTRFAAFIGRFAYAPGWRAGAGLLIIALAVEMCAISWSLIFALVAIPGIALVAWGVRVRWAVLDR